MTPRRPKLSLEELRDGVLSGNRGILARAITLMESSRPADQTRASNLLTELMPHTGNSMRVGITGVPGVGKSTFIETLGGHLTSQGRRVAVLAVDPSSAKSGGSILGDKTRMDTLSIDANAFIRPSPASGTLGGVASKTREAILCCEAAGFDTVLVETVGVGQSELVVADMTDFFLVLMLAGAGDELQGIKRGLMELADMLVVNKADGDMQAKANRAAQTYRSALALLHTGENGWKPPVLTCSALNNIGVDGVWDKVTEHHDQALENKTLHTRRTEQQLKWLWSMVNDELQTSLKSHPSMQQKVAQVEDAVRSAKTPPTRAARELLSAFYHELALQS
ncbi:MAG: methylmalonyl Co-A mutase-associated GTPase MeaB [Deltaproteobacteria bacterium]|nr:methylmalonyl Co-A mutase-associated GTPase MeaB [Deltaproteobacteria bacterium]MBT6433425.1 methylmalonyl Co-A mutase-associated GTPase MeaB [Deltaproteobacteria bacterium]